MRDFIICTLHHIYGGGMIKLKIMRWVDMKHTWEKLNAYEVLVRKFEQKRPLGRPKNRWKYSIRMALKNIGCKGVDWILTGNSGGLL
jgi:hypothetical protein